jgi:hypothetical protein
MYRERHTETLEGEGLIWLNGEVVVRPAIYRIDRTQRIHISRTHGGGESSIPGMSSLEGHLSSPFPLSLLAQPIELELADGRRWACFIQSTSGRMVNRGGIE